LSRLTTIIKQWNFVEQAHYNNKAVELR